MRKFNSLMNKEITWGSYTKFSLLMMVISVIITLVSWASMFDLWEKPLTKLKNKVNKIFNKDILEEEA